MTQVKKIEEMIENAEKKIHAGEWLRVDIVRRMMSEFAIWMNEEFKKTLIELQEHQLNMLNYDDPNKGSIIIMEEEE